MNLTATCQNFTILNFLQIAVCMIQFVKFFLAPICENFPPLNFVPYGRVGSHQDTNASSQKI